MSTKLMDSTEKELESLHVGSKDCLGCQRHNKDIMIGYSYTNEKKHLRVLPSVKEVEAQFKDLGIDKKVLAKIIEAAQTYKTKEEEYEAKEFLYLFMTNKQAENLAKELQTTLEFNRQD
jgi:uncharacterized protein (UPF0335 family)